MRLRIILIVSFLLVAGIPLVAALFYVNTHVADQYKEEKRAQLSALSLIARSRIETANERIEDNLKLISSRTQLRISLSEWNKTQDPEHKNKIHRILTDAQSPISEIKGVFIYDLQRSLITTTNPKLSPPELDFAGSDQIQLVLQRRDDQLVVIASDKLVLNDEVVGFITIVCKGNYITDLIKDRSGLGKTGEWLFAQRNENGDALFAVPLKYDINAAFTRKVPKFRTDVPIIPALNGQEILLENAPDYRDVPVMASTRYLKKHGWGLVVKIDQVEVMEPVSNIKKILITLEIILTLVSIILGMLLSHFIANPVEDLQRVTAKIKDGDLNSRAEERGWGEVKNLSMSFNSMADTLKDLTENLQLRVKERTAELDKANEQLTELAIKDPLTNLFNRRYFFERLHHEFDRVVRYKGQLAILMFDIDHFKSVNDNHGHQVGDEILKLFSSCLTKMLRKTDILGRVGGEEFCAIVPEASIDAVKELAIRICEKVSELLYPIDENKTLQITTSIGGSIYEEGVEFPENLIERADKALYDAKEGGRNKAVFYGDAL